MTIEDELTRLEALCERATEPPWHRRNRDRKEAYEIWHGDQWLGDMWTDGDVRFVLEARTALPALLRIARAADAVLCRSRFRGQWLETPAYSALAELDRAFAALGGGGGD